MSTRQSSTSRLVTGRPRSQESHTATLQAALELLIQQGYNRVSIEAIAAKAGVSKATIYRWWPGKAYLVIEVLAEQLLVPTFHYEGGDIRKHLLLSLRACYDNMLQGALADILSGVIADTKNDIALQKLLYDSLFRKLQQIGISDLDAAIRAGQVRADIDREVILDQLFGTLYYRTLIANKPVDEKYLVTLLDNLMPVLRTN